MDKEQILSSIFIVQQLLLFGALIVCAYTDLTKGKILNMVTFPIIGLALGLHFGAGGIFGATPLHPMDFIRPPAGGTQFALANAIAGMLLGGGMMFIIFLMGGLGMGDVKLMATVGALMGSGFTMWALFYTALVGGLLAISVLIWRGKLGEGLKNSGKMLIRMKGEAASSASTATAERITIPYGLAIAFGTFWTWFLVFTQ